MEVVGITFSVSSGFRQACKKERGGGGRLLLARSLSLIFTTKITLRLETKVRVRVCVCVLQQMEKIEGKSKGKSHFLLHSFFNHL